MKKIIDETCEVLKKGGTILYPTDTIWGIGCDACNYNAIAEIHQIKNRDLSKSMLILVDSIKMMQTYTETIPDMAIELIEANKRPLTIIYPNAKNLPANLIAKDGSIGIRIVKDDFCRELIKNYGKPIVSTSANKSGQKPPLGYFDIDNEIKIAVSYIVPLKIDELSPTKSSDIIKIDADGNFIVIR